MRVKIIRLFRRLRPSDRRLILALAVLTFIFIASSSEGEKCGWGHYGWVKIDNLSAFGVRVDFLSYGKKGNHCTVEIAPYGDSEVQLEEGTWGYTAVGRNPLKTELWSGLTAGYVVIRVALTSKIDIKF